MWVRLLRNLRRPRRIGDSKSFITAVGATLVGLGWLAGCSNSAPLPDPAEDGHPRDQRNLNLTIQSIDVDVPTWPAGSKFFFSIVDYPHPVHPGEELSPLLACDLFGTLFVEAVVEFEAIEGPLKSDESHLARPSTPGVAGNTFTGPLIVPNVDSGQYRIAAQCVTSGGSRIKIGRQYLISITKGERRDVRPRL